MTSNARAVMPVRLGGYCGGEERPEPKGDTSTARGKEPGGKADLIGGGTEADLLILLSHIDGLSAN